MNEQDRGFLSNIVSQLLARLQAMLIELIPQQPPNRTRQFKSGVATAQVTVFQVPTVAKLPCYAELENVSTTGILYAKIGVTDEQQVSSTDYGVRLLPGDFRRIDPCPVGRVIFISDTAGGVELSAMLSFKEYV